MSDESIPAEVLERAERLGPADLRKPVEAKPVWQCKIGILGGADLPDGADAPMRRAVQQAFYEITGRPAEFVFSGWSAELTEGERAVLENR